MLNLSELKKLVNAEPTANLGSVEQMVLSFLKGEKEALSLVKTLSGGDLELGINNYLEDSTLELWLAALSLNNLNLFIKVNNRELNLKLKDWVLQNSELATLKAEVNLETLHCKLPEINLTAIFVELNIPVDCSQIPEFTASLQLVDESPNQYFASQLVRINGGYKLVVGDGENQVEERISWWKENLVKQIQIATVCVALFGAIEVKADDTAAALNAAKGAALAIPEVKETVEQVSKRVTKAAEKIVEETGTKIPVTVVGYGVKAAIDQKVEVKKINLNSLGLAMDSSMAIGFDGTVNLGLGGKTPMLDNGTYKIQGSTGNGNSSVEFKLNFGF